MIYKDTTARESGGVAASAMETPDGKDYDGETRDRPARTARPDKAVEDYRLTSDNGV